MPVPFCPDSAIEAVRGWEASSIPPILVIELAVDALREGCRW
jgi:hypothetical protein